MPVSAAMANQPPVGEDAWLALAEEKSRNQAKDLTGRIEIMELYKQAVNSEPGSIRVWIAYAEYFWSLYADCQSHVTDGPAWAPEEKAIRELFSLDTALNIWQQGYESTKYRLSDSHELWNRWIALEMELLSRSGTSEGIRRITHLFRNRLQTPHKTWDETSQMFSSFLSEYNTAVWEGTMKDITGLARQAKALWEERETFEIRLNRAAREGRTDVEAATMKEYLEWEMKQSKKESSMQVLQVEICLGLWARAQTGIFARDQEVWSDLMVWVSSLHSIYDGPQSKNPEITLILPNNLDILQRAVQHCPWTGELWARYILSAEEAGLSFHDVERIKHAATMGAQIDKDDVGGVIDMYAAWCGFLKRRATDPNATDEDADVADIGLTAALEDVQVWYKRRYHDEYKGDPNFRLERIFIQYMTEKRDNVDDARNYWNQLAQKELYADSYTFWLAYYTWEMQVFTARRGKNDRSPTPVPVSNRGLRVPSLATGVLQRAVHRQSLDWPEKVMEIYLQHCNDYETSDMVRRASDAVHKGRKAVAKRREQEAAATAAAYSAQYSQYQQPAQDAAVAAEEAPQTADDASASKRKRGDDSRETAETSSKRVKQESNGSAQADPQQLKRDRENTSIFVTNLPLDVTQTRVRQHFREYGHIKNLTVKKYHDEQVVLIEFDTPEEAQSALLRDGKYLGQTQLSVIPATGTTLFVTNYPPKADEAYIRDLFSKSGEVFSVRFPSLKYNTHRRFCYVTFREAESAARATKLDGTMLEDKFKLDAKYSNPIQKKQRVGAIEEGRELHVTSVDMDADETDIKAVFEKYGTVERVRITRNQAGVSRGTAFVVFATKEQAETALAELDKSKFMRNILNVEKSQPVNYKPTARTGTSASPAPSSVKDEEGDEAMPDHETSELKSTSENDLALRTFALLGLPDTVNDARVRALVEPHGHVTKLTLRPDHGGAILEFADAGTAGKVQLGLESAEFDGRKLKTGSVRDLFKEKSETRIDRIDIKPTSNAKASKASKATAMMPPPSTMIRRPALGGKSGAGGQRRGLGFTGAINKASKPAGEERSSSTMENGTDAVVTPAPAKKSNNDFRAMLLGKGAPKKESEQPGAPQEGTAGENGDGQ